MPIRFDWQLPWADFDKRMNVKVSEYIGFDTTGTARFSVDMFVNNFYYDRTDPGEEFVDGTLFDDDLGFYRVEPVYDPALTMEFLGGDTPGFGADGFGMNFGGGRVSNDERLFSFAMKFKLMKLRMYGETMKPLRFVSLSMAYKDGSVRN